MTKVGGAGVGRGLVAEVVDDYRKKCNKYRLDFELLLASAFRTGWQNP